KYRPSQRKYGRSNFSASATVRAPVRSQPCRSRSITKEAPANACPNALLGYVTRIRQTPKPAPPRGPPDQGGREAKALPRDGRVRTRLDHARQRRQQVGRAVWHRSAVCPPL